MLKYFRFVLFVLFAILAPNNPASARALTPPEQASLDLRRDQFLSNVQDGNFGNLLRIIPPSVLAALAQQSRVSEAALVAEVNREANTSLAGIEFTDARIPTNRTDFRDTRLSNGKIITWAYTYSTVVMRFEGTSQTSTTPVLLLREAGVWYMMRVSANQVSLVRSIYPFVTPPPS
jgi:hypothetical protein